MGIYSVSKHAVVALSECLRHDLEMVTPHVHAALLCPSYVSTDIGQSERTGLPILDDSGLTKSARSPQSLPAGGDEWRHLCASGGRDHLPGDREQDRFYVFPALKPSRWSSPA